MSIDPKFGRFCDECGRTIANAVRVYLGKDYCRACYQRTFLPVPCSQCGKSTRPHRHAAVDPVCDPCVRSKRTCLRCGKLTLIAGKLVGRSAVCPSCTPRFADKQICGGCGRESLRLTRPLFAGLLEPVCDSCRNKLNHATCSRCKRYRPVASTSVDGTRCCKDCVPGHETMHECPGCGCLLNGGGFGHCRSCINRRVVEKDAALVAAELEAPWCRDLWHGFVLESLSTDANSPRLRAQVNRSSELFRALDQRFVSMDEINSRSLLQRLDSQFLRLHLKASRYVVDKLKLHDFTLERVDQVEAQRSSKILAESADKPHGPMICAYAQWLTEIGIAARTGRLYLRAAESFCRQTKLNGSKPWQSSSLVDYLKKTPGNAANIARFVRYCREQLGWNVEMPHKAIWCPTTSRNTRDIRDLRAVLKTLDNRPDESMTTKELARVLSLALGISAAQLMRSRLENGVLRRPDGSIEIEQDAVIEPSNPLYRFAQQWAVRAEAYLGPR